MIIQKADEPHEVTASCLAHRVPVRWLPAPMWWHHDLDLSPCDPLWVAPSPLPRDKPFRYGRYGEQKALA